MAGDEEATAAARDNRRRRATAAGDEEGGAAGLPFTLAHLKAAAAIGGDGANGAAARLDFGRRRDGLTRAAAALRSTGEDGSWGKRKRKTRGSYL